MDDACGVGGPVESPGTSGDATSAAGEISDPDSAVRWRRTRLGIGNVGSIRRPLGDKPALAFAAGVVDDGPANPYRPRARRACCRCSGTTGSGRPVTIA